MNRDDTAHTLDSFFKAVPEQLDRLRKLLADISACQAFDDDARLKLLIEFSNEVKTLKEISRLPALVPVWQMAFALEGLIKQPSSGGPHLTPSAVRTATDAVDLLESLCVRSLKPDLATQPPVRVLVVDDDPISCRAISFALKKAFNEPDLAPNGQAGLARAARSAYDVIFLDVEMPGMDGFELCAKIHETASNRSTPVVFVTAHPEYGSRAKCPLSGGYDLITKPFPAFEFTVKALTLVLRARLRSGAPENGAAPAQGETELKKTTVASSTPALITPAESPPLAAPEPQELPKKTVEPTQTARWSSYPMAAEPVALPPAQPFSGSSPRQENSPAVESRGNGAPPIKLSKSEMVNAVFTRAPVRLEELRNQLLAARHTVESSAVQKVLAELCAGVQLLNIELERAELGAMWRLSSALQGMLKKLLETAALCNPCTLNAAAAALDLLEELCVVGSDPDLNQPPIRILVVDDDPVARRAICGSLQLAFGRPEQADGGEAAMAIATEKPFDLIFLDVLMPGLDGFAVCSGIHKTTLNSRTPIVFVTSANDRDSVSQAAVSGGSGFIAKPVLPSQIKLMALTFILRARLNQAEVGHAEAEPAHDGQEAACATVT